MSDRCFSLIMTIEFVLGCVMFMWMGYTVGYERGCRAAASAPTEEKQA